MNDNGITLTEDEARNVIRRCDELIAYCTKVKAELTVGLAGLDAKCATHAVLAEAA